MWEEGEREKRERTCFLRNTARPMGKQCLGQLQSQSKRRVSTPGSSILLLLLVYVPNPLFLTECLVVTVSWPNTGPDSCGSANERMRALVSPKKTAERSHTLSLSLSPQSYLSRSHFLTHSRADTPTTYSRSAGAWPVTVEQLFLLFDISKEWLALACLP